MLHTSAALRVLILDDNQDCADSLASLVRLWNFHPITAYLSEHAIALAQTERPHVGILDLSVPRMNGLQVAERLLAMPELADMVLIALTGVAAPEIRERALLKTFDHYFLKPVEPEALKSILDQAAARMLSSCL